MDTIKTIKEVSAGGVVLDQNNENVLMIQVQNMQGKKIWTFPKGHQEEGESLQQSALREVEEETGWKCEIAPLPQDDLVFYQARYFFHQQNNDRIEKNVTWFLMRPIEKTGSFDEDEVLQAEWVSLAQLPDKTVYDSDKKLTDLLRKLLAK